MSSDQSNEKAIFNIARQIGSNEARQEYLSQVCGDDHALIERVGILLEAYFQQASFLESPAAGRNMAPTIDEPYTSMAGDQIGPYKLLQQIGEGGMGTVWMAEQHEPVRRRVALKLIKAGMDSRQVLARFEAERQALSMMDHPNIARVLDAGTVGAEKGDRNLWCEAPERPFRQKVPVPFFSGRPYFVMELVKGQPITSYCDEKHLNPRERLELFLPVCHAIQHAHQKGIIHRDIKPSNVLVAEYDGRPVAKVIDFGVAKAVHQPLTERTMFTGLGQIIGTLEYMSPEQARVNQLDIDTRSDVYSLGVLLYELLTGSTPFDRQRMREAALDELLRIIREEEPPRPSTKLSSSQTLPSIAANRRTEPARLSTLVRGELDWIVMKALEKDRNRRYETANGFAMDIQRYLAGDVVQACPPSAGYRLRKVIRRNKAAFATATLVTAVLVLGLIGTTWQAIRATQAESIALVERDEKEAARREAVASAAREAQQRQLAEAATQAERLARQAEAKQRSLAELAQQEAAEEAAIAKGIADFLREDLLGLAGAKAQLAAGLKPDPDLKLVALLDRALETLETRLADQPRVRAEIRGVLADAFHSVGRYSQSVSLWEQVVADCEELMGPEDPNTLRACNNLAIAYDNAGDAEKAFPLYERTLQLRRATLGPNHHETLSSMSNLAAAYKNARQLDKAIPLLEESLEQHRNQLGADHPSTLTNLNNLADGYRSAGKTEKALPLLETSLKTRQAILGMNHPDTWISMGNLASGYADVGQFDRALPLLKEVLQLMREALGPEHPHTLTSMGKLAQGYYRAGDYHQAILLLEELLKIQQATLGAEHPHALVSMGWLAGAYQASQQLDKALPLFQETLERRKATLGAEHPDTLISMVNLAMCYRDAGQLDKALEPLTTALQSESLVTSTAVAQQQMKADFLLLQADCLSRLERGSEAEGAARQALEIRQRIMPEQWGRFNAMSMLGESLMLQGKFAEAETLLVDGYQGLKERRGALPGNGRQGHLRKAVERLVTLYTSWNQPDQRDAWQRELESLLPYGQSASDNGAATRPETERREDVPR